MKESTLEQVNTSALKLLAPLSIDETFAIIVAEAKKIIGGDFGSISLEEKGELKRVYADAEFFSNFALRKRGFTYDTFTTNQPKIVYVQSEKILHPIIEKQGIKSIIYVPLSYKDKTIGVLTVHSKKIKKVSKNDMHFYMLFGSLASMAIRKTQLYDETKNALETRDLFISLASHELRTPLTSINGYIHLLSTKLSNNQGSEGKWIKELSDESKRLTSLITELLEINRIKQGQLHFEFRECGLPEFIEAAIERYHIINPDRKIIYTATGKKDVKVIGDINKLLQMVTGLINNADKFSPHDQPIKIMLKSTSKQIILTIKDEGKGIEKIHIERVFDGFFKGENNQVEGLGVGLLLAKYIVSSHHGSIQLKSKKRNGTTVEVKLPVAA